MATENPDTVRIRFVVNGRQVKDEVYSVSEKELLSDVSLGAKLSDYFSVKSLWDSWLASTIGFFGATILGLGWINVKTVEMFIDTMIAGPALKALIDAVVKNVSDEMKKRGEDKKAKKIHVILYGPDGKEIKWDK